MSLADGRAISPHDIVDAGLCIGCGSCAANGRDKGAAMRWDKFGQLKPSGPAEWYRTPDEGFSRTCPFSPKARDEDQIAAALYPDAAHVDGRVGRFETAYVGHVAEQDFRTQGSSGGMVTWVAAELIRRGMVDGVAHVAATDPDAEGRFFGYRISRSEAEVRQGAKSRYYPIELSDVITAIRARPGRYAVIGVPCFIKAINLLRREDPVIAQRVTYTLGLYCGHMKSAKLVDSFALQMGKAPDVVQAVNFRTKDAERPANWYRTQLTLRGGDKPEQDWWHLVEGDWGSGFFQNSACDFCDDVVAETADISFGDAWLEPYSSDPWGTNVVVVRSPMLRSIVDEAVAGQRLKLSEVDAEFVVQTQAAGFRQRREGLAFRLARRGPARRPLKRVAPGADGLPWRRKLVYWTRGRISAWSHRLFLAATKAGKPELYFRAGRLMLALYQGLIYSRGRAGAFFDRVEKRFGGKRES